jgi:hypothetical protein
MTRDREARRGDIPMPFIPLIEGSERDLTLIISQAREPQELR